MEIPLLPIPEPNLWKLHHNTEADWRRILDDRPEAAARWIAFAAERGFKAAQVVLGQMHLDGHGVARDPDAAYRWFAKAARIGSAEARNMLGRCHEYGWGTPIDHGSALLRYAQAAAAGSAWGSYNVGCLRLYGDVPRNHAEAFARFTEAAAGPDPAARAKALGMLARCHEEGWGTPVDPAAAARSYRAAADGGDCWGALNFGLLTLDTGDAACALPYLERALALAPSACRIPITQVLADHADPAVNALAQGSSERIDATANRGECRRTKADAYDRRRRSPLPLKSLPSLVIVASILAGIASLRRRRNCLTSLARRRPP